jgi:hypothetical protein
LTWLKRDRRLRYRQSVQKQVADHRQDDAGPPWQQGHQIHQIFRKTRFLSSQDSLQWQPTFLLPTTPRQISVQVSLDCSGFVRLLGSARPTKAPARRLYLSIFLTSETSNSQILATAV